MSDSYLLLSMRESITWAGIAGLMGRPFSTCEYHMSDTLRRQWEIVKHIPRHPHRTGTRELEAHLKD